MALKWSKIDLRWIGKERNFRMDHERYLGEKKFGEFISRFDSVAPLGIYISAISNGQDVSKDSYTDTDTRILYLSVNQIAGGLFGKLNLADAQQLAIDLRDIKLEVEPGDILITRSGTPGIAWLATREFLNEWEAVVPSGYIQRLKLKSNSINPQFLVAYLNLYPVRMLTASYACGKDQYNLSQEYIRQIPIPVLSQESEQKLVRLTENFQKEMQVIHEATQSLERIYQNSASNFMVSSNEFDFELVREYFKEIAEIKGSAEQDWEREWRLPRRRGPI